MDYDYTPPLKNVDALLFNTVQDGFLGGYLAAGMTKTGKVATFGGQKLPTVTIYMDGFYDGVQYYNQKHGTHVQVLGWNEKTQNGNFTGDFTDQTKGLTSPTRSSPKARTSSSRSPGTSGWARPRRCRRRTSRARTST